jgi:hypothetical protein
MPPRNSPFGRRNRPPPPPPSRPLSSSCSYVNAGLAGCGATCVVHPADVVKTRLQMSGVGGSAKDYTGMFDAFIKIFKTEARHARAHKHHNSTTITIPPPSQSRNQRAFSPPDSSQGPTKLYSGLSAGLFRQITCVAPVEPPRGIVTLCRRYTMPRLGLFDQFKTIAAKHNGGNIEVRLASHAFSSLASNRARRG